jgi:hypothetical protein
MFIFSFRWYRWQGRTRGRRGGPRGHTKMRLWSVEHGGRGWDSYHLWEIRSQRYKGGNLRP